MQFNFIELKLLFCVSTLIASNNLNAQRKRFDENYHVRNYTYRIANAPIPPTTKYFAMDEQAAKMSMYLRMADFSTTAHLGHEQMGFVLGI